MRAVLVLAVGWLVLGVAWMTWAAHAAESGRDHLVEARTSLSPDDLLAGRGTDLILEAEADFQRASSRASSPVTAPLRLLPGISTQVESFEAITTSAAEVSGVAAQAVEEASAELNVAVPTGQGRIDLLEQVADVAERAASRVAVVDLGPEAGLVGPVRDARDELSAELTSLELTMLNARDAAGGMAQVFQGPSRYLLLAGNNAEMRAGSGMFLSIGVLSFEDGELALSEMEASGELTLAEGVAYTDPDLEARWGWAEPDREWRNLAMSPRFPANAEMASRMWEARGGDPVDGVLAVDPVALQSLLAAIGPVEVDGEQVDDGNVVSLLLHDQYLGLEDGEDQEERREALSDVAEAVVERFDATSPDLAALADGLRTSAAGRHLLLWSGDRALQRVWADVGVGGAVDGDDLYLSVDNYGQNKLDQFLEVEGVVRTSDADGSGTTVVVEATLRNTTPDGEPGYITGEDPTDDKPAGTYAGLVTLTMPQAAEVEAEERFSVFGPDGDSQVVATEVKLEPGEETTVEITFRLPAGVRTLEVGPSARIPGIAWRFGDLEWSDEQTPRQRLEW